jgi:hypothetical protein
MTDINLIYKYILQNYYKKIAITKSASKILKPG